MNAFWYKVLFSTWVVLTRLAAVLLCGMAVWNLVSPPDQAPDLNVLLLTIDSLRPDHLGCYGYPRETSPNLDRLARDGVRFAQVINQTAWTTPSLVSVLTALYPETHGVDGRDKSTPLGLRTPMRALQRWGYAVPALCYLIALPECSNLGFTSVQEKDLFRWLEQNRHRRFFVWSHLEGPHLPYNPAPPFDRMFVPDGRVSLEEERADLAVIQRETVIPRQKWTFRESSSAAVAALYDGEVRQTDEEVGRLLAKLEALGLGDKTLIVVTADHGEELFDHGFVGHASTSLAGTLYDEVIRVPLIMRLPGVLPAGTVVEAQIEGIDVMPTIFAVLGLPPLLGVQGESLLPLVQGKRNSWRAYAFSETLSCGRQCREGDVGTKLRAVRTQQWKLIAFPDSEGERYELYNLQSDPDERKNVFSREPRVAAQLRQNLAQWQALAALRRQELLMETARSATPGQDRPFDLAQDKPVGLDQYPEHGGSLARPVVLPPQADETLSYEQEVGRVRLAWVGDPATTYEVQYDVGVAEHHLEGVLTVMGTRKEFGPLTRTVWDLLPLYNPFRFRVRETRCGQGRCWSDWLRFRVGEG